MTNQVEVAINQIRHLRAIFAVLLTSHVVEEREERGAVCRRSKLRRSEKMITEDSGDKQSCSSFFYLVLFSSVTLEHRAYFRGDDT